MNIGIKRSHRDYVRFVLLGRSRTGSNFVRGLLNSHPQIIAYGEVFKTNERVEWGLDEYPGTAGELEMLQRDPTAFLEQALFRGYPNEIAAVGFKLFYYHARENGLEALWPYLEAHNEIRVLHVKRRNMLRTHLSRARAVQTDRWANVSGEREAEQPITLDFNACLDDFTQTSQWEADYDRFFSAHPKYDVIYEDLLADFNQQATRIQDFLGVKRMKLEPDTYKQSQKPLSQAIANYQELKEKFAGTRWEKFFDEPE